MRHGEPNHTCRICGKPYFACDTCDAKIGKTWRAVACTAEHYDVFLAMWKYTYGQMSEEGIKKILTDAKANTWTASPSYDAIIALIGEPKEEEEVKEEPVDEHQQMPNLALVKDKPAETKAAEPEKKAETKPANKQKYYNGNYRDKVVGKQNSQQYKRHR